MEQTLRQLAELQRLDLDLLVRDVSAERALALLAALRDDMEAILDHAAQTRARLRGDLEALEAELAGAERGSASARSLESLAGHRRNLVDLDQATSPAHQLYEEVARRCALRAPSGPSAAPNDAEEP